MSKQETTSKEIQMSDLQKGIKPAAMTPLSEGLKPTAMTPVAASTDKFGIKPVAMTPITTQSPSPKVSVTPSQSAQSTKK